MSGGRKGRRQGMERAAETEVNQVRREARVEGEVRRRGGW